MKIHPRMPGRLVRTREGYEAFLPAPLPPAFTWTPELVYALSDADRTVGRLAGEGGRMPNPHILMRAFMRREAVLSSRIEGTQATLGELLASEAGAAVEHSPADLKEVGNYVVALEHGIRRLGSFPLSLRLLREIHEKLMRGVRGGIATPGEFRRSQNWIGPAGCTLADATYVPPPPDELIRVLGDLEMFLHDRSLPPLVQIALAHYQFEAIHPFLDGNGRVGRLLITLFLVERGILPTPLLYLSAFFEVTRPEYYERLSGVSERGEWVPWLLYFLRGVSQQAADALDRAKRINTVVARWRETMAGSSSRVVLRLVDELAANPYLVVGRTAKQLKVAYTTIQRAVEQLEEKGILTEVSKNRRNRVWCAKRILAILEKPASFVIRNTR